MAKLSLKRTVKRFLPTQLFARAVLILLVPVIILQALVAYIFYERHWDSVARHMSNAVAADIAMLVGEYHRLHDLQGQDAGVKHLRAMASVLGIRVQLINDTPIVVVRGEGRKQFPELYANLATRLDEATMIQDVPKGGFVRIRMSVEEGVLEFIINRKRLASSTTYIFMFWMVGSSILLMIIAILFLRNQVRPIVHLARAAEQFGLGQEVVDFAPRGASEIKRASSAFLIMADRIRRTVTSRTEMLAGISHDLRTPLTRMKLEIEMGKIDSSTRDALEADIDEMRRMIDEYLDFARGDAGEPMEVVNLSQLLRDMVASYVRQGRPVGLGQCDEAALMVRPQAIRRALTNLIDNALRYGTTARIELEQTVAFVRIKITDSGPGIAPEDYEAVFKPFTRLEASRNINTGGVGLGLSIARDIAQSHGGTITLENQKDNQGITTGLEATLRLPREVQTMT